MGCYHRGQIKKDSLEIVKETHPGILLDPLAAGEIHQQTIAYNLMGIILISIKNGITREEQNEYGRCLNYR